MSGKGRGGLFGEVVPHVRPPVHLGPWEDGLPASKCLLRPEVRIGHSPAEEGRKGSQVRPVAPQAAEPGRFTRKASGEDPASMASGGGVERLGVRVHPRRRRD